MPHSDSPQVSPTGRRRWPLAILTPLIAGCAAAWAENPPGAPATAADCAPALARCEAGLTGLQADLKAAQDTGERQRGEIARTEQAAVQLQTEKSALEARVQALDGETAGLKAELAKAQDAAAARERDVQSQRAESAKLAEAGRAWQQRAEAAEAKAQELTARVSALEEARAGLEAKLAEQTEASRGLEQRLAAATARGEGLAVEAAELRLQNAVVQRQLTEATTRGEGLAVEAASLKQDKAAVEAQLAGLRAEIPVRDGGTLDADALRQAAGEAAAGLVAAHRAQLRNPRDPALSAAREAAVSTLADGQARVARATGARGMYRIRAGDSLARVARTSYGELGQWQAIYEANRHVLPNPDLLVPDMTLVVP